MARFQINVQNEKNKYNPKTTTDKIFAFTPM